MGMRRFLTEAGAQAFRRGRLALAGAGAAIACCHGAAVAAPVEGGASVTDYCAAFALAYGNRERVVLIMDSVRIETGSEFAKWVSNLFQPPGSRFTGGYRCRFAVRSSAGIRRAVSVHLYLAETHAFAEHTQWERLQIVPVERVVDQANGRTGFGVFKYLWQE